MDTGSGGFRGRLRALGVVDVLSFLSRLGRPGLLSMSADGVVIGLTLRDGNVVQASSTREADRLTDLLLRDGMLTGAQLEVALQRMAEGERLGRALVSTGALTPRGLVEARQRQVRQIARSVFEWDSGEFVFVEGARPSEEAPPVEIPILDLVVDGLRSLRGVAAVRERMPSRDWVFEPLGAAERRAAVPLEPQEQAVLGLVDGARSVGAIIAVAEFPDHETLRTLLLLFSIGYTKMKTQPSAGPEAPDDEAIDEIVRRYNAMLGSVYQYMMREIGPIVEPLLTKSLRDLKGNHPVLLSRAALGGDGTIDADIINENLRGLSAAGRRDAVVHGLNELLYAELLVLRRTLGVEHEGRLLRSLRGVSGFSGAAPETEL